MAEEEDKEETKKEEPKEAKGKGGSPISITNIVQNLSEKKHFLRYFFITVIVLFILWYFGFYNYISTLLKIEIKPLGLAIWAGTLVFIFYIIWGFSYGIKNRDKTAIWVALVLLIWLWDFAPSYIGPIKIPYGGIPFQGFIWNLPFVLSTTWASILFSSTLFAFLYINMVYDIIKKEYPQFLLGFLFILITSWLGPRFLPDKLTATIPLPWGNLYFFLIVAVGIGALYLIYKSYKKHGIESPIPDFISFLFFSFFFSFFWINNGWFANPKAVAHAAYIVFFGLFYIAKRQNPVIWRTLIIGLLLVDFYGYGLLFSSDILALQFIPVLVLFVVFYCYHKTESTYALTTFIVVVTIILVLTAQAGGYYQDSSVPFTPRGGGSDLKDFLGTLFGKTQELITQRLDIATAGLYSGNVEKNRYESLGVYFSNIRAADPRFYTDEPITLWGTIRSKTYQDAVIVNFSCYRWDNNKKIMADKIIPSIKFPIFTLEDVDTECTFFPKREEDKQIKPGPNTITFSAEYNFGTDAYIKSYFIDRDRFKAYSRENLDPLTELGIKDKNPTAIFTNGPVEIGIKAGPLITVSEGYAIKPTVGITLTNRKEIEDKDKNIITKWEGKIKNITELILLVPPGIEISNLDACTKPEGSEEILNCPCTMPFVKYDIAQCQKSCANNLEPCNKVCGDIFKDSKDPKELENCKTECTTTNDRCELECDFLFKPEEGLQGNYKGYALDINSLKFKDLNKDIDKHRSFQCRLDVSSGVLDPTPITTRYFRVRARYNYFLENSVQVNVEALPSRAGLTAQESLIKAALEFKSRKDVYVTTNINPDYLMAIAYVESGLRHCCQEAGKTSAITCSRSDEMKCPSDRIINSGTSIGIMQIRYDTAKAKKDVDDRASRVCANNQNVYDFECNINLGIDILNEKYRSYQNGCKNSAEYINYINIKKACDECTSNDGMRYESYIGADAAARGYNGWGCGARYDRSYVKKIQNAYAKIKNGIIVDESIHSLFSSREGEGMVPDSS